MRLLERQRALDTELLGFRNLWHPQPFREIRPDWCEQWPALADELLAQPDDAVAYLNDDLSAALSLLATHISQVSVIGPLTKLQAMPQHMLAERGAHWAWEIPGRKRQQIEAFVAATESGGQPVLDWCGGKGHLGRLLAQAWQTPVHTLEIDAGLCESGSALARRADVMQEFVISDAMTTENWPQPGQHAVALHACGELHRRLIQQGAERGVGRFDVAPCCYYRGVAEFYRPLSEGLQLSLSRDDTRLAVTETVTASPRETRKRDREMAWKLGFDAWRREVSDKAYRSFKPVPDAWMRAEFTDFLVKMSEREGLPVPSSDVADEFEARGWQRRHDLMRLSIVRHAFRRAIEVWLALDLAVFLEAQDYVVNLGSFCERHLTPRNLLISARRV